MRYRICAAMIVIAAVLVPTFGFASAADVKVGAKGNGLSICEEQYLSFYEMAQQKFGSAAVGANVVDDGVGKYAAYDLPESMCESKAATLDAMLHPPAPEPVAAPTYSEAVVPTTTSTGGGCVGMEAESGSAGYDAYNPDGGYIGCYQISPDHYTDGVCTGMGQDPAGQDACAAAICATEGAGAWTNASGANPC